MPNFKRVYSSEPTVDRQEGVIVKFNPEKGFGFIRTESGQELFFHRSAMHGVAAEDIRLTMPVRFIATETPKGPRAEDVELV